MSATQQQEPTRHRAENQNEHRYYPEDEIELMDYLLVIWKWKYIILTGTFDFALAVAIISFITWKQQVKIYHTNIVIQPGIIKINERGIL
jgi:LPS O-antigen subunit length determinant protein (WzzB/FepE family)